MKTTRINTLLRDCLKPVLKKAGFSQFTTRSAWRYENHRIDVFRIQIHKTVSPRTGSLLSSFSVELGCMLDYIPCITGGEPVRLVQNEPRPEIFHCTFQRTLQGPEAYRPVGQPYGWLLPNDSASIRKILSMVSLQLQNEGLLWFRQFADPGYVLDFLSSPEERKNGTWGYGRAGTPFRHLLIGFAALKAGYHQLAYESLLVAQAAPGIPQHAEAILDALNQIKMHSDRSDAA